MRLGSMLKQHARVIAYCQKAIAPHGCHYFNFLLRYRPDQSYTRCKQGKVEQVEKQEVSDPRPPPCLLLPYRLLESPTNSLSKSTKVTKQGSWYKLEHAEASPDSAYNNSAHQLAVIGLSRYAMNDCARNLPPDLTSATNVGLT